MTSTHIRAGITEAQYAVENGGDLEYRAIADARDAGPVRIDLLGERVDGAANETEGLEHQSHLLLDHPLGVVALLRHGPRVAYHDDGQSGLQRFAQAAGTGFADEEIRKPHEIRDLRGKSDDYARRAGARCPQFVGEDGVVAADQDELGIVEAFGDTSHDLRAMSAEQDDAGRAIRVQAQFQPLDPPVESCLTIKIRTNDHP